MGGQVREEVPVAPAGQQRAGFPELRLGVLDAATHSLPLAAGLVQQPRSVERHLRLPPPLPHDATAPTVVGAHCTVADVRVLVSPDKFKGTLTAAEAARAIGEGWRRALPEAVIDEVPLADGGEGTLDVLVAALGGRHERIAVTGPLGEPVEAEFGLVPVAGGPAGIVEMARASGLALVPEARRDPKVTTTRGTGELMVAACRAGARRLIVCVGGSATNDAGAGMAQALGIRLLDARGLDLGPGGAPLLGLARIDIGGLDPAVRGVAVEVATDVDNPLVGPDGASAVYGPQKGAAPQDVVLLDRALARFAEVVKSHSTSTWRRCRVRGRPAGSARAWLRSWAPLFRSGVDLVMEAVGFGERLRDADLVVTGEGTFDEQSLRGKVAGGVLAAAAAAGLPAVVLCGRATVTPAGATVRSLVERFGVEAATGRGRRRASRSWPPRPPETWRGWGLSADGRRGDRFLSGPSASTRGCAGSRREPGRPPTRRPRSAARSARS